ncbi:uncharacterized protein SPSK_03664 [Sporothrix schenckii 1099-18]|uniref:Uncharacterized protein n=1 Tax=Sporothrix schenckii 1099-18 TaxID=1397361 RepID=A0A0F2LYX5_SPOSC|nr:uncharacterized protein SPSK_03664 [Sporothrix schenckii 1099-18]KJR82663.1 hypothetical protein SPSK_03664 [Sporothrix schenckii 1099-18]
MVSSVLASHSPIPRKAERHAYFSVPAVQSLTRLDRLLAFKALGDYRGETQLFGDSGKEQAMAKGPWNGRRAARKDCANPSDAAHENGKPCNLLSNDGGESDQAAYAHRGKSTPVAGHPLRGYIPQSVAPGKSLLALLYCAFSPKAVLVVRLITMESD